MIKATVKNRTTELEFPCLMKHTKSKQIVLFERHGIGTRLNSEANELIIGYHSKNWYMDEFEPFTGTLSLSNKETS